MYQEDDERFYTSVGRTSTGRYIVVSIGSKITSEAWVSDADDPEGELRVVAPRRAGVEYDV